MRSTARCSCVSSLSAQQTVQYVDARRRLLSRWQLPAGSVMSWCRTTPWDSAERIRTGNKAKQYYRLQIVLADAQGFEGQAAIAPGAADGGAAVPASCALRFLILPALPEQRMPGVNSQKKWLGDYICEVSQWIVPAAGSGSTRRLHASWAAVNSEFRAHSHLHSAKELPALSTS